MRRLMQILMVAAVLWCSLHVGEPAHALDWGQHHQLHADTGTDETGDQDPDGSAKVHFHHHCQLALNQRIGGEGVDLVVGDTVLFARPTAALHSLSEAPPVEPPAA